MNYSKIGSIEGIFLVCIGILNHAILYLPQSIFNICGTSSILNIIYISLILFLFLFIFIKCYKYFYGQDILDISKYLGGNILKYTTGILFLVFYFILISIMARNFAEGINLAYFTHVNLKLILLSFFIIVFFANTFGKSSIIKCNTIITFTIIISLLVLVISILPNISINKMYPIFGNGINATFIKGLGNLYAFSGICMIFFISPMLADSRSINKIAIVSYCIISIILFLVVSSLLLALSFLLKVNELSPIYLLLEATQFGNFFQNSESFFILIWILSIMSFLCVYSMLIILIFQKLLNFKDSTALSAIIANLIFVFALIPKNFAEIIHISSGILRYLQIIVVFVYSFAVIILACLKKKKKIN